MRQTSQVVRFTFLAAGMASTALGLLGIFLPLLPTTPFLLLAAACFARSSEKFYRQLVEHPRLGPLIGGYLEGSGIPRRSKAVAIVLIWITLFPSAVLFAPQTWVKWLLIGIALAVTLYLLKLPTRE